MRKLSAVLAAACLTPAFCLFALAASPAAAYAAPRSDTAGTVSGTLVNGTRANTAVGGTGVTLQAVVLTKAHDVASATTDAHGHFQFTGLDTSGATTYAVYVHYKGGLFTTPAIRFESGPIQQVTLTAYDVTASAAAVRVVNATILVSKPNQAKGILPIGEFVTFENTGPAAYVGTTAPANGLPMNLLRFALPDGATNLTLGAGFDSVGVVQVPTGFGAAATLPPGQSAFAFAFAVPYTGTQFVFSYKAEYPSDHVVVLLQPNVRVLPRDFTAEPAITASGQRYQVLARDQVAGSTQLTFGVAGLPLPGQDQDLDFRLLALLGAALLLLLGGMVAMYLRRGALAAVVPLRAPPGARLGRSRSTRAGRSDRQRLLSELLALEALHDGGAVSDAEFIHRRDETRAELRELVLAGEAAPTDQAEPPTTLPADPPRPDPARSSSIQPSTDRRLRSGGRR